MTSPAQRRGASQRARRPGTAGGCSRRLSQPQRRRGPRRHGNSHIRRHAELARPGQLDLVEDRAGRRQAELSLTHDGAGDERFLATCRVLGVVVVADSESDRVSAAAGYLGIAHEVAKVAKFFRVNRQLLVNIESIKKVHTWLGGRLKLDGEICTTADGAGCGQTLISPALR